MARKLPQPSYRETIVQFDKKRAVPAPRPLPAAPHLSPDELRAALGCVVELLCDRSRDTALLFKQVTHTSHKHLLKSWENTQEADVKSAYRERLKALMLVFDKTIVGMLLIGLWTAAG